MNVCMMYVCVLVSTYAYGLIFYSALLEAPRK